MKSTPANDLKLALEKLGAREFEMVALGMDPHRGLAAIAYAESKGAEHPVSYAIKIFDNPDWQPRGEKPRNDTNITVKVTCAQCSGDRFIAVTDNPKTPYGETYKPCSRCNGSVDAGFFKANGERFVVAS